MAGETHDGEQRGAKPCAATTTATMFSASRTTGKPTSAPGGGTGGKEEAAAAATATASILWRRLNSDTRLGTDKEAAPCAATATRRDGALWSIPTRGGLFQRRLTVDHGHL